MGSRGPSPLGGTTVAEAAQNAIVINQNSVYGFKIMSGTVGPRLGILDGGVLTQVNLGGNLSGAILIAAAATQVQITPAGSEESGDGDTEGVHIGSAVGSLQNMAPGDIAVATVGGVDATGKGLSVLHRGTTKAVAGLVRQLA